jgi:Domain of unknown function (DUF4292)
LKQTINIAFLFVLILLASCARRNTPDVISSPIENEKDRLDRMKTKELVARLDSLSDLRPQTYFSRIKVNFSDKDKDFGIKVTMRFVKDSAMGATVSYSALPVASALIRPDSVQVTNKVKRCYIKSDMAVLNNMLGSNINYSDLEELILGLPIDVDTSRKYVQIQNDKFYIVSTHRKGQIKREERQEIKDERRLENGKPIKVEALPLTKKMKGDSIIYKYYLDRDVSVLRKIEILSPDDSTEIVIDYLERDSVAGYQVPRKTEMYIRTPKNTIHLILDFKDTELNMPQEIVFVIPEGYGECTIEEESNEK